MILLSLAGLLCLPIALMPSEWAGWIVCYASFAVIPILISPRRFRRVILTIWITLAVHHAAAIANVYMTNVFRAPDAERFHSAATYIALRGGGSFAPGAEFYRSVLGLVYSAAGPSLFLGQQTSIFAYALSCIVLVKLMVLLKIERHQAAIVSIFGLLPALILYSSSTLRESWQILFFMSSCYFLIRFRLKAEPWALVLGTAAAIAMGFLHNGLLAYALCMIPFILFSRISARSPLSLGRLLGLSLTVIILAGLGAAVVLKKLPQSASLEALAQGDALEYAAQYREAGAKGARAEYGITLDTRSPLGFVKTGSLLCLYYMLAPFPWQISTGVDIIGAAETWFRALLVLFAVRAWRSRQPGVSANIHRLLIALYFSMSVLWALGTINYGTAIRHHLVAVWIPVLLGVPPFLDALDGLLFRYVGLRRRQS